MTAERSDLDINTSAFHALIRVLAWVPVSVVVGCLAGASSAVLLLLLEWATATRTAVPALIWMLPVVGAVTTWAYTRYGGRSVEGNRVLFEEIDSPRERLPLRMAPMILVATTVAHLAGASVGREGTAMQMSVPLADQLSRLGRWNPHSRRVLLTSALSAGFASVFGTPIAGMFFGLEVRRVGRANYDALLPCLISSLVGNEVALALGAKHAVYDIGYVPPIDLWSVLSAILAGIAFGVAAMTFVRSMRWCAKLMSDLFPVQVFRPVIGGAVVVLLGSLLGTDRFFGLGLPMITEAFTQPVAIGDFGLKGLMTVVSLATGFRGGEVTPLFVTGATLGNAMGNWLALPRGLLASMGFVGVFAGASNAPIASFIAGIELFGSGPLVYLAIACVVSYYCSGNVGMYTAQAVGEHKVPVTLPFAVKATK